MITFVANIEFYTYMNLFFCVEVLIYFARKAVTFFSVISFKIVKTI